MYSLSLPLDKTGLFTPARLTPAVRATEAVTEGGGGWVPGEVEEAERGQYVPPWIQMKHNSPLYELVKGLAIPRERELSVSCFVRVATWWLWVDGGGIDWRLRGLGGLGTGVGRDPDHLGDRRLGTSHDLSSGDGLEVSRATDNHVGLAASTWQPVKKDSMEY